MSCTSGCRTKDHSSYGECLRANTPSVRNSSQSRDQLYGAELRKQVEVTEYRKARSQGIQPKSTQLKDIRSAVAKSQRVDRAVRET